MSAVIIVVVIIVVLLVLLALGCFLDLCGDSSPGVGSGKSGLTPGKILPAGLAIAGLSAIASHRRSSADRHSGEYWSTTGHGSPAVWEGALGGVGGAPEDTGGWGGGHSGDVGGGDLGGVCDV